MINANGPGVGAGNGAQPGRAGDLPALLALAAAGGGLGLWIWVRGTPRLRVLVPGEELAYLHGQPAWPLAWCLVVGLGAMVVAAIVLGRLIAAGQPRPAPDWARSASWLRETAARLPEAAMALLPAGLLGLVALTWWLPLGLLSGPVSVLLDDGQWVLLAAVLLTLGASVGSLLRPSDASPVQPGHGPVPTGRVAAAVFALVAVTNLAFLPRATLIGPTGDEPDYLLLAHSLVVDRDLDLRNQVEQRDYQRFTPRLQPHVREGPFGGLYTAHRPGLPLLVAPAYGLGLWTGWPVRVVVMVELCLLAAWLAARLATWASGLTGDVASAALAGLVVAFTAPGFYYAFAIYPELPAALVVLEALAWIGRGAPGAGWGSGLLIAGLPWLHEKFVPLSLTLAVLGAVTARGRRGTLVGLGVPLGVSAVLQALYYWQLYGAPIPTGVHAGFASWSTVHQGLIGLWVDRDHGLLTLAPVFLVAAAGIPALWRAAPRLAGSASAVGLSLYLVVGVYREWWGGFAPPPRYLVPLLPVLGLALAFGLREWRRRARGLRATLLGAISVSVAAAAVIMPGLQYRHAHPIRSLLPSVDWTRYLPAWLFPDARTWPLTGLFLGLAALVLMTGRALDRSRTASGPAGLRLTAAGLLTLGVLGLAVSVGDRLTGARAAAVPRDLANADLRAFLYRVAARGGPAPWPVTARPAVPREGIQLVYPVGRLPGHGRLVPDPLAEDGEGRVAERPGVDIIFGPYEQLPRGRYRIAFRMRLARAVAGPVATVGISAARGKASLLVQEVAAEVLTTGAYREVVVELALPDATADLEWRVRAVEPGATMVDRVTVTPLDLRLEGDPR